MTVTLRILYFSIGVFCADLLLAGDDNNASAYLEHVKPVLRERCYSCHGPLKQEANLRLDTVGLMQQGGDSGSVIVPGDIAGSLIFERISEPDASVRMPPEGKPLTAEQIEIIRLWIDTGAEAPPEEEPEPDPREHWSFQPPQRPPVPSIKNRTWARNPIDFFITAGHDRLGLSPAPFSDPATLMRRVSIDLIGIPPTREELHLFLKDYEQRGDEAYEQLVDRLLDSPQYGERWGRHWMDVWRYSDWYGRRSVDDVRNSAPHIWRWRDWIINSLNDDRSYADMLTMMLAADEIAGDDDAEVVANGFIVRNWYSLNYDTWMRDLVEHTGKAFLGVRLNCCLCHDHKYDPISQEDHFAFRAFFEPLEFRHDRVPGGEALPKYLRYTPSSGASLKPTPAGLARIYEETLDAKTFLYQGGDARDIVDDTSPIAPGVPSVFRGELGTIESVAIPPKSFYPGLKSFVREQETATAEQYLITAMSELPTIQAEYDASIPALQQAVDIATAKLVEVESTFSIQGESNAKVADIVKNLIGHWRFEGAEDELFLADASGRNHGLYRVTGTDPPVSAYQLPFIDDGMGTFFPSSPVGVGTETANRQAAHFHQHQNFSFVAAEPHVDFSANQFTFETLLHIAASSPNMNRTLAELPGSWVFLHRGLDDKSSELRLLYYNTNDEMREFVTGGEQPLLLTTGHDYYIGMVFSDLQVTLYVRDLSTSGELQSRMQERKAEDADFLALATPATDAPFRIGNSDGTGRHVGLLDEVRFWNRSLTSEEITVLSAMSNQRPEILAVKQELSAAILPRDALVAKLTSAEAKVVHAKAQLASIAARAAADEVRFLGVPGDVSDVSKQAFREEKGAVLAAAQFNLAQAQSELLSQKVKLTSDPKMQEAVTKAEKAVQAAQSSVNSAVAELEIESEGYSLFSPEYPHTSTGRRTALAKWIADASHPRTSRVAVNHIWMRHFGNALVEPVYDIGPSGRAPTHPELIDWLAVEFTDHNWSMKWLHRLIVTSSTYRLSSSVSSNDPALKAEIQRNQAVDKDNAYYWIAGTKRLEAEVVRDSLLHLAGELDTTMGGPELDNTKDLASRRRSLYFTLHPEDGGAMPFLSLFDPPDPQDCYRRSETLIPQQALGMINGELTQHCSRRLTSRLQSALTEKGKTDDIDFIMEAFLQILSRPPNDRERELCMDFLAQQANDVALAKTEGRLTAADAEQGPSSDTATRARESLIRTLFNHHEFITIH
ncbi:MAG: DUF1553 domain-containing protein [Planctomycetota bacterium]|nr:DUF1553 domain-containing protein [Planctomycetota bacterium]MDA1211774.1 DUF1553 domain-containing protein [Planctomycetota bacterium]